MSILFLFLEMSKGIRLRVRTGDGPKRLKFFVLIYHGKENEDDDITTSKMHFYQISLLDLNFIDLLSLRF
jgi:hypothetical protein